ncbi:hypothetical protein AWB79_05428 [Caballeronia hypogeia]|uniref:Uncharacterized protein n=1 Tax=Caballeronia hypogeia TaxID=1777140 RepID=A0A158CI99_9BURK|nr:hypothetical protein [Caballeronia hypogeia]SAK82093.1 hypothetical protein AWB79_05428 [Caballeronia hypogeia]
MGNSYQGRYCGVCEHELPHGYFSLSKRSQTVTGSEPGVVLVSDDEGLTDFCSQGCAEYAEAAISSTLSSPYPGPGQTVPCSLCLRPVDRTSPHVSVSMSEFEDASEPWLVSARVVDERELAVYCHGCAEPRLASMSFDESELGVGA